MGERDRQTRKKDAYRERQRTRDRDKERRWFMNSLTH